MARCACLVLIAALLLALSNTAAAQGSLGSQIKVVLRGNLVNWPMDGYDQLYECKTDRLNFFEINYVNKPVVLQSDRGYVYPITFDSARVGANPSAKDAQSQEKISATSKTHGITSLGWQIKVVATKTISGEVNLKGIARYITPLEGKEKAFDGDLRHIPGAIRIDLDDNGLIKLETWEIDSPNDYSLYDLQNKLREILHSEPEWNNGTKEENLNQAFMIVPSDHTPKEKIVETVNACVCAGVRNLTLSQGHVNRRETAVIQITEDQRVNFAGEMIDMATLKAILMHLVSVTPDKTVIILAGSATDNQRVGDILNVCFEVGVRNFALGWPGSNLLSPKTEDLPAFQTSLTPFLLTVEQGKDYDLKLQAGDGFVEGTIRCDLIPWPIPLP